jgi:hypothetical protein
LWARVKKDIISISKDFFSEKLPSDFSYERTVT